MAKRHFCLSVSAMLALMAFSLPSLSAPAPVVVSEVPSPLPTSLRFDPDRYMPAIVRFGFARSRGTESEKQKRSFIDITLIPPNGPESGYRVELNTAQFAARLRLLYGQMARQESLDVANPASPARELYNLLFEPLEPVLREQRITTLLIAADPGLQALPFAALHDGSRYLGERFAFSLTPSLGLMPLDPPRPGQMRHQLAAGASRFKEMAPLPLVPQELDRITAAPATAPTSYLDEAFTPGQLLAKASDPSVDHVHVATHAEFLPGGAQRALLHTGTEPMSFSDLAELRQRRESSPLQLLTLSACRTALGDTQSELGFAGIALQAGARSAIGSLWYVDDVATSAYFVQLYRYLDRGFPKAEALQRVRTAMLNGQFRLDGQRLIGPDGTPVLDNLTGQQARIAAQGFTHPFFWAGIELLGTPW